LIESRLAAGSGRKSSLQLKRLVAELNLERADRRIMAAVARHVSSIVEGTAATNVVSLR
jgi:hypothetical protein